MKSYRDIILFALVIIGSAAAGIWVLEQNKSTPDLQNTDTAAQTQDINAQEDTAANKIPGYGDNIDQDNAAPAEPQMVTIEQQFEDMLNEFLMTLDSKSQKYKSSRRAITDIIKPENVRAESFLEENKAFATSLVEEMELQMDDIINSFDNADQDIKVLITAHPEANKDLILQTWNEVKRERMENYMSFFLLEKDFLDKHLQILNLIDQANGQYTVDVVNNQITFQDENLAAQYQQYLSDIETIKQQEDLLFAADSDDKAMDNINTGMPQYDEEPNNEAVSQEAN